MLKSKIQNPKSKINANTKYLILLATCYLLLATLMGCAMIIEGAKGFWGTSTKVLKDNRNNAITKTFNYDYNTCYSRTKEILEQSGAYIYAEETKKQLLAIYISEKDTTPVGLFFSKIDENSTQIEVSSPSTYAKELISAKVFSALEGQVK